jgi:hypothetical protein
MKNIHILPTDKPSRLVKFFTNKYHLSKEILPIQDEEQYQNIFIISSEVIKDKDYVISETSIAPLYVDGQIIKSSMLADGQWGKIILTTDSDLIKDGVQAIDDEFLEWFVKNPSCEYVEVNYDVFEKTGNISVWEYDIIIPQEEPKQ